MSRPVAFLLVIISAIAYVIGIAAPIATVTKSSLLFGEEVQYSIVSTIAELYGDGEVTLALLIAAFSLLFPVAKYICLIVTVLSGAEVKTSAAFRLMKIVGKWSMLDVFVVAMLLVMMKLNGSDHWLVSVQMTTEPGIFVYAFSVISSMILASRVGMMRANYIEPIQLESGRTVRPLGFWIRLWAGLIDTVLLAAVVLPLMLKAYGREYLDSDQFVMGSVDFIFSYMVPAIVTVWFWKRWQATPGKLAIGARLVDARTGDPVPVGRLFGRYFGYYLTTASLGIGAVWIALDGRRQGWHDKVARTLVVEAE